MVLSLHSSNLGDLLRDRAETIEQSITIIAPFITRSALEYVLEPIDSGANCTVITRWNPSEIAIGVSDLEIWEVVAQFSKNRILLCDDLHAKIYLFDDAAAFIGSANVTRPALGMGSKSNIELLYEFSPVPLDVLLFVNNIERSSYLATQEIRDILAGVVAGESIDRPVFDVPQFDKPLLFSDSSEFPGFRSPDRIFNIYSNIGTTDQSHVRQVAADLSLLGIPMGLSLKSFNLKVRESVLGLPLVKRLNSFLSKPRRFGELRRWVEREFGIKEKTTAENKLQTIIRWLLYVAEDQYELDTSRHSEKFHLKNS